MKAQKTEDGKKLFYQVQTIESNTQISLGFGPADEEKHQGKNMFLYKIGYGAVTVEGMKINSELQKIDKSGVVILVILNMVEGYITWTVDGEEQKKFYYDVLKDQSINFKPKICFLEPGKINVLHSKKVKNSEDDAMKQKMTKLKSTLKEREVAWKDAFLQQQKKFDDQMSKLKQENGILQKELKEVNNDLERKDKAIIFQ